MTGSNKSLALAIERMEQRLYAAFGSEFSLDSKNHNSVLRLEVEIQEITPLEWLENTSGEFKLYWSDRAGEFETAATGVADMHSDTGTSGLRESLYEIQTTLDASGEDARYYGGMRFDADRQPDDQWQPYRKYLFVLPRFEIYRNARGTWLVCNLLSPGDSDKREAILGELRGLAAGHAPASSSIPAYTSRTDIPDVSGWRAAVKLFLSGSRGIGLEKLVLARRTDLCLTDVVPALSVTRRLKETAAGCFTFYIQPLAGTAFTGATPEQLYRRDGSVLKCEAIAGTRRRGDTEKEDLRLGDDLKQSKKDLYEHRFVVKSIRESLSRIISGDVSFEGEPETVVRLNRVQHLITHMSARLSEGTSDARLIDTLHPTAAVGGYHGSEVMSSIRDIEEFDRGWYAGPIGWLSRGAAEFAVAIRSALVAGDGLSLFAGAGIVEGSDADMEWSELESKISGFMKILTGAHA